MPEQAAASPTVASQRIGDVPVFSVEAPGPARAMLAFRVGRADEALPWGGITHLVEHLALLSFRDQPYRYGGQVEASRTVFWAEGTEGEITGFLNRLCQNLSALPVERLQDESRLLRTEAASRKTSPLEALLGARYGTRSFGVLGYPEYGLWRLDQARVREWADRWFTADNAVLGVTGAPPQGLSLMLKRGSRMRSPAPTPVPLQTPAWMYERYPGIALGLLGPRSTRFGSLMRLLERRARDRLRFTDSLSYEVGSSGLRVSAEQVQAILWADGLAENMSKVWNGLLAVLDELMEKGPSAEDIREDIEGLRKATEQPSWPMSLLDAHVNGELYGTPALTLDQMIAEMEASGPAEHAALLTEIFPTLIAALPTEVAVLDRRFAAVPGWSTASVPGRQYELLMPKSVAQKAMMQLTVGEEGVSMQHSPGNVVTVRYRECSAALAWDDGSRTLLSWEAFRVHLRPVDWKDGAGISAEIDRHLPPDVVVPRGPRPNPDPEALSGTTPLPASTSAKPATGLKRWQQGWRRVVFLSSIVILGIVAIVIIDSLGH